MGVRAWRSAPSLLFIASVVCYLNPRVSINVLLACGTRGAKNAHQAYSLSLASFFVSFFVAAHFSVPLLCVLFSPLLYVVLDYVFKLYLAVNLFACRNCPTFKRQGRPFCHHLSLELVFLLIKTTILIFFNFGRIKKAACAHATVVFMALFCSCSSAAYNFDTASSLINWKHYYGEISLFFFCWCKIFRSGVSYQSNRTVVLLYCFILHAKHSIGYWMMFHCPASMFLISIP